MEKIFNGASVAIGIFGGIAAKIWGGWDAMLHTLIVLMCMDYATGIIKAIYKKELSSEIGWKGLLKKVMTLIVVALANVLKGVMGDSVGIREVVIVFFAANEGISILENAAVLLPNMPDGVKEILLQLRGNKKEK